MVGTETVIETTRKIEGAFLAMGGEGTKKVVQQYKVPPDTIKELRPLQAIYYSKDAPEMAQMLTIPFVELTTKKKKHTTR